MAIAIWQPRYSTKEVLVAVDKVGFGRNTLFFCCDDSLTSLYSFDGDRVIRECKTSTNGKIKCYAIPMGWLEEEGPLPERYEYIRNREKAKHDATLKRNKKKSS